VDKLELREYVEIKRNRNCVVRLVFTESKLLGEKGENQEKRRAREAKACRTL